MRGVIKGFVKLTGVIDARGGNVLRLALSRTRA